MKKTVIAVAQVVGSGRRRVRLDLAALLLKFELVVVEARLLGILLLDGLAANFGRVG